MIKIENIGYDIVMLVLLMPIKTYNYKIINSLKLWLLEYRII